MYVCAFKSLSIPHVRSWEYFGICYKLPPPCMDHSGISNRNFTWSLCFGRLVLTFGVWQSLQAAVQRVHAYVQTLEEKMDEMERKGKK